MAVDKGHSLGPYEILGLIGEGGMGQVWRARDQRIGRDVAVKVLAGQYAPGDELVRRFEQEARTAGALNHPGLVTIFDVGTTGSSPYIVMELLEGQTLRDVIGDGAPQRLPLRKAVDYASQIASALAVAHEKGIIHRDLKPENIFITPDRRVKILDFGLAKLAEASDVIPAGVHRTRKHLTAAGMVVGTPGYMSPEQVRAEGLDHRTDIFSLGALFYEMLTGRPAFEAESVIETMHAVLNTDPPPLDTVIPDAPPALEAIVRHCLEKNPRDRFQSARDLAFQLQMLPDATNSVTGIRRPIPPLRKSFFKSRPAIFGLAAVLAAGVAGFALFGMRNHEAENRTRSFRQATYADGLEIHPSLAPDGKSFAYVSAQTGNRDIYVQRVDGRTAINVTADYPDDDSEPAFSPDGSQIAFRSERLGGGIFVMGVTGESPRRLTDFGHNPAWSPDGTRLVFSTEEIEILPYSRSRMAELWIVDVRTGTRRPLVQPKKGGPDFGRDSDGVQPSWSPHGKRIAFWGVSSLAGQRDIWTIDPDAAEPKKTVVRVTSAGEALHWNPVWSPDGKYLYYGSDRDGTLNLWRIAMDEDTGSPVGEPESVELPAAVSGHFAFSATGEMAFVAMTNSCRLMAMPFDVNAATIGPPRQIVGGSQEIADYLASPDGRMIAYTTGGATQEDVFVADADGSRIRQLTNDPAKDRAVEWSPDGTTLYFYSNREGDGYRIWSIRADGSDLTRVTDNADLQRIGARNLYNPSISPDGRTLYVRTDRETAALVHLDRPAGSRLEAFPVYIVRPKWSPDGQWLVGRDQRLERDLDGEIVLYSLATKKLEKLAGRGAAPQWTPDSKKIVYFEQQEIRIIDLATRAVTAVPFKEVGGVPVRTTTSSTRLSKDAATLYLRQIIQQGDIWIARFPKE